MTEGKSNSYAPPNMGNLFVFQGNIHNNRNFQVISNKNVKIVGHGLEAICHRTPLIWTSTNLPIVIKLATSLKDFKTKIKSWKCNFYVFVVCVRLSSKA